MIIGYYYIPFRLSVLNPHWSFGQIGFDYENFKLSIFKEKLLYSCFFSRNHKRDSYPIILVVYPIQSENFTPKVQEHIVNEILPQRSLLGKELEIFLE